MSLSLPVPLCACTCVPISVRNSLLVFMCRVKTLPTPYSVSTCLHQFACLCVCDTPSGCKCLAPPPIRSPFFFDSDTPDLTPGDPRGAHQTGMVGWVKVDVVDPALWCMWMKSVCVCVCKGGVYGEYWSVGYSSLEAVLRFILIFFFSLAFWALEDGGSLHQVSKIKR